MKPSCRDGRHLWGVLLQSCFQDCLRQNRREASQRVFGRCLQQQTMPRFRQHAAGDAEGREERADLPCHVCGAESSLWGPFPFSLALTRPPLPPLFVSSRRRASRSASLKGTVQSPGPRRPSASVHSSLLRPLLSPQTKSVGTLPFASLA